MDSASHAEKREKEKPSGQFAIKKGKEKKAAVVRDT